MIFSRASLSRSPRTRTRKTASCADMDLECPNSRSSLPASRKTRPPPLQIIPEMSEDVLDIRASNSPQTARPTRSILPRTTLSAYTFSIDDRILASDGDAPRSPSLYASSSTSDGTSSEGVPTTPGTSDDEDVYDFMLPTPRFRPQHISIYPLRITKSHSIPDEDMFRGCSDREEENVISFPITEEMIGYSAVAKVAMEEADQDFYTLAFEDFISLSPATPSPTFPARRDSLILVSEVLHTSIEASEPKLPGRSRHSKPLPLLPPVTPPLSTFPMASTFPLVQTTAHNSVVRRKRSALPISKYPPSPPPPVTSRPLPRTPIPLDIDDCIFAEEGFNFPSRRSMTIQQAFDAGGVNSIWSQSSLTYSASTGTLPLQPTTPGTPLQGTCGEIVLPRSSTDSDAPRSSIDSTPSTMSLTSPDTPASAFSFPDSPSSEERLRSRWSCSTLGSVAAEPSRTTTLLSPLKSVLSSKARRMPLSHQKAPSQTPLTFTPAKLFKSKHSLSTTPSPPRTHVPRPASRSSTSSAGASSSECESTGESPGSLKRKPIPLSMFMRAT